VSVFFVTTCATIGIVELHGLPSAAARVMSSALLAYSKLVVRP
jgi:hypothetical protein